MKTCIAPIFACVAMLSACATSPPSPELLELAKTRKGNVEDMTVALDNFSGNCGHATPGTSAACAGDVLRRSLNKKAADYCVFYTMGEVRFGGFAPGLYPRNNSATARVTCTGPR
jgi:hypothetical protein